MKKALRILSLLTLSLFVIQLQAQTYKTRDGRIFFNPNKNQGNKEYSAETKEATAVFKVDASEVALLVPMKSFHFNNALLEEHFNENYLHTNKFPNGTFKGKLVGFQKDMLSKDGTYNISSEGTVELHGVKKPFKSPVVMTVKGKAVTFDCQFNIKAENHDISIPDLVKPKLMENTPISASVTFKLD